MIAYFGLGIHRELALSQVNILSRECEGGSQTAGEMSKEVFGQSGIERDELMQIW